jgi:hypothetical protein
VFWEIKNSDREIFEKAPDFNGYFLKVCRWGGSGPSPQEASLREAFTVFLTPEDSAWYLGFPPADENEKTKERYYKIEL